MTKKLSEIKGVIPALITCFDEAEKFDEKRMRGVVRHLLNQGVHGFYLTGSTGEAFLMNTEERKRVVEVVCDEVKGRLPIIAHIGAIHTTTAVELATHAYEAGVDAISSVPPFYWRFSSDHIYRYYEMITQSNPLPMIVYNIALAGTLGFDFVQRLATIPGVEGMKFTNSTHYEIQMAKSKLGSDFVIYSGADEMALSGLAFGSDGIIGSFYNLIPEIFLGIYNAIQANDLVRAEEYQRQGNEIIMYFLRHDFFALMKLALGWIDVDAGYCRTPFFRYDAEREKQFRAELKALRDEKRLHDVVFLQRL